jgi:hypothetical protein
MAIASVKPRSRLSSNPTESRAAVLRFRDPADVLAAFPEMLPQLPVPRRIFQGAHARAIPQGFAQRASALLPRSKVLVVDFRTLHSTK